VETVLTIAHEFDVDVNWLLTGQVSITSTQTASIGSGSPQLPWLSELEPRLAAMDETSQLAIKGALEGMLGPLEAKRLNETLTKPPPRKAAAGPARARRR
jgi:hypothetical protein